MQEALFEGYYQVPQDAGIAIVAVSFEGGVALVSVQFVSREAADWLKSLTPPEGGAHG